MGKLLAALLLTAAGLVAFAMVIDEVSQRFYMLETDLEAANVRHTELIPILRGAGHKV